MLIHNNGRFRAEAIWNHHNNHNCNRGCCTQLLLQPVLRTTDQSVETASLIRNNGRSRAEVIRKHHNNHSRDHCMQLPL